MPEQSPLNNADRQRIEEITRIVVAVIEELPRQEKRKQSTGRRVFTWISENKALLAMIISALGLAIYQINPFHDLIELRDRRKMVRLHIKAANEMLDVGQLGEARSEFENALKLDANNSAAHLGLIKSRIFETVEEKTYDPEVTQKRLQLVLELNPEDPLARLVEGSLLENQGKLDDALAKYNQVIGLDKRMSQAYAAIGGVYDKKKNLDLAIANYKIASELSPSKQLYLNNLGYLYYQKGDYRAAIALYYSALQLDSRFLITYCMLPSAYRLTGDLNVARIYQEEMVKLLNDPTVASLQRNKGGWLAHTDGQDAYLFDLNSKKFYALYSLALTLFLNHEEARAAEQLKLAEALKVDHPGLIMPLVHFDIKKLKAAQPQWEKKLVEFEKAIPASTNRL